MPTTLRRAAAAAVSAMVAVAALLVPGPVAAAAPPAATAPAPGPVAPLDRPGPAGRLSSGAVDPSPDARRADGSLVRREAAALSALPEVTSVCPSGQSLSATYATAGFEDGKVPHPDYSVGWTVGPPSSGPAPEGALVAATTSVVGEPTDHVVNPVFATANRSGSLYVSLTYRGTFEQGEVGLYVNDQSGALAPSPEWRTVRVDATAAASFGVVEVFVDLVTDAKETASTVEIDDVRAWSCAAIPATGVRGDWNGDTLVDLLGITAAGDLWLYPGRGNGAVSSGVRTGAGWGIYDWVGSPGDVTGDRRSDLVGRSADGLLYLYAGVGRAEFNARRQIGSGWGSMTAFATPTDMDLDGRPELLARRSDSTLHLYSFTSTGALRYRQQVGSGWNQMAWIIGMGDLSGDRRGDTVGVNRLDACLYAYVTTSRLSLGSATRVGCGWGSMTYLTSPGDLNRDGLGDLVARAADGGLWFYPGRSGGGVRTGTKVGSGWASMAVVL